MQLRILIITLIFSSVLLFSEETVHKISWEDLGQMDFSTEEIPSDLMQYQGEIIEISGMGYPDLAGEDPATIQGFFLLSAPLDCCLVEPPPLNQIIYTLLKKEVPIEVFYSSKLTLTGRLEISMNNDESRGFIIKDASILTGS